MSKAIYEVRFTSEDGPERFLVLFNNNDVKLLMDRLAEYEAAGLISGAEIGIVDDTTTLSRTDLEKVLGDRFGVVERGLPDASMVEVRFDPKTEKMVRDLLVSAFEGGSNYWYRIESEKLPTGTKKADFKEGGRMQPEGEYYHWSQLIPTYPGGQLVIRDISEGEGETHVLDLAALRRGWLLLKKKYPESYKRVLEENYDANDGDLFLQLALFGELVFG